MKKIHLCFACDENYIRYAAVALYSALCSRARGDSFCVWIISEGISQKVRHWFVSLFPAEEIYFIDLPSDFMHGAPLLNAHLSHAAYARLALGTLLPQSVKKVVYLDCDLLVFSSLRPLACWNLQGKAVVGVEDWGIALLRKEGQFLFPWPQDPYIGSGLLVVDLVRWREIGAQKCCEHYVAAPLYPIRFEDQDVLNFALHGHVGVLPPEWDVCFHLSEEQLLRRKAQSEWIHAMRAPKVVHFATAKKPWKEEFYPPYTQIFRQYMALLGVPLERLSLQQKLSSLWAYWVKHPVFFIKPSFWKKWNRHRWAVFF